MLRQTMDVTGFSKEKKGKLVQYSKRKLEKFTQIEFITGNYHAGYGMVHPKLEIGGQIINNVTSELLPIIPVRVLIYPGGITEKEAAIVLRNMADALEVSFREPEIQC